MAIDREDLKRRAARAIDNASDEEIERGKRDETYAHDWLQNAVGWIAGLMTILGGLFGGCFITSTVCKKLGKPDNHSDMELLRDFRDTLLQLKNDSICSDISTYYFWSPAIIKWANSRSDSEKIWKSLIYITMTTLNKYQNYGYNNAYTYFKESLLKIRGNIAIGNYPGTYRDRDGYR